MAFVLDLSAGACFSRMFPRVLIPAALVAVLALIVASCGTVSKAECQSGNWYGIGLANGRDGATESLFDKHVESCKRFGLPADRSAWMSGRAEGLKAYCTPVSGYANGSAGREYANVCSGKAGGDFVTAYGFGLDVYEAKSIAWSARERARSAERDADRFDDEIRSLRARRGAALPEDRDDYRNRIQDLQMLRLDAVSDGFRYEREAALAERSADIAQAQAIAAFIRAFGYPPQ